MTRAISTATLPALVMMLAVYSTAVAQAPRNPSSNVSLGIGSSPPGEEQSGNPMADEMRVRREIRYAEKEHRENLDRAQEASELAESLASSFRSKQRLDRNDVKKLERLEKLANKIREEAGGSDNDFPVEKKPSNLAEAIERIAEISKALNERVQKTPRRVVSAATIDKANVLLELIRIARGFFRKD